jgi:type 1 glutamine amidotransferase
MRLNKFHLVFFLCLISFILSCSVSRAPAGKAVNWRSVKVLVYTKNGKGYVHKNIPAAVQSIREMGKELGFQVDVSDTPLVFTDENLRKYNTLIFTSTNNDVFDNDAQKVAFMRYTQAGGGFVGIHSVTGTERNWPWFKRLVGGTFVRHANFQKFQQVIIDTLHPSTRFLPRNWEVTDECYYIKEINPDIRVLAVHNLNTVDDKDKPVIYGNAFPSVWTHEFDGGRQWYTALGHDSSMYKDPVFRKHILGGIQWVVESTNGINYSKARAKSPDDPLPW